MENMLDHIPSPAFLVDADTVTLLAAHDSESLLLGRSCGTARGECLTDLVGPGAWAALKRAIRDLDDENTVRSEQLRLPSDGGTICEACASSTRPGISGILRRDLNVLHNT